MNGRFHSLHLRHRIFCAGKFTHRGTKKSDSSSDTSRLGEINLIRVSSPADVECNDRLLLVASFVKSVYLNVHRFADWKWFVWNVAKNYSIKKYKFSKFTEVGKCRRPFSTSRIYSCIDQRL